MGKFVLIKPTIKVNNVDLSDHASSVTIETNADDVDLTGFTETYKEHGVGLRDATISVDWFQDYQSGSVNATLWPFVAGNSSGGTVEVVVRQADVTSGTASYTMAARIFDYQPLQGGVGAAATISTKFDNAGTAGLTYGTA